MYFSIPVLFRRRACHTLNIMKLHAPRAPCCRPSSSTRCVIWVALIPLAVARGQVQGHGLVGHPAPQRLHLRRRRDHRPFVFIKLIDLLLVALHAY